MTTAEPDSTTWQAPQYSSSVTIGEFFRTIRRNAGVFWTTLVTIILIGALISFLMPKKYAAGAEVLVEGANAGGIVSTPDNVLGELNVPNAAYPLDTQIELLQSQDVYFRVLDAAGIAQPNTREELERLPRVFVRQKDDSNIFIISVEGSDKDQVLRMAQHYPEEFRQYADSFKHQATSNAVTFVNNRLTEEHAALRQAESDFAAFKVSNAVADSGTELTKRLELLTTTEVSLADAKSREAAAVAAVDILQRELEKIQPERTRINEYQNESVLREARAQLNALVVRRAQYLEIYLPTSREVREIDNQIEAQQKYIDDLSKALKPVISESNPEWDTAQRRLSEAFAERQAAIYRTRELEALVANRTERLNQLADLARQQRDFERRIALHTQSIASMSDLLDRVKLRDNALKSNVQPLTRAVFAQQSQPNWLINMSVAAVLGLALAVVFSLVRDSLLDKVNSKEEAYILSGLAPLAHIPERSRSKHPIITNPQTNLAFESYRVLRSNIAIHARENELKSLTVTSTLRKEGKSVVAANLAIAYVLNGQRTILVDANLRTPTQHTLFGLKDKPGLGDVLLGTATLEEVLQPSSVDGLYVVSAGTIPANATEVIGSPRMQEVISILEQQADIVVFDAPQVVGLADAQSLAAVTDAAILVTDIGRPGKAEFKEAVSILEASSPALIGLVENRVSAREAHLTKI